jgi:hypothetical protein
MQTVLILALVAATSVAGYLIGRRRLGLAPGALRPAAARLLECLGLAVLFLLGNQALGVAAIVAARAVTGGFVSLYMVDDVSLLGLSLLQALLFAWWRRSP